VFDWIGVFSWIVFFVFLVNVLFFHLVFDYMLASGVTFLMKLRSGGLLFREKRSMGDLRGSWEGKSFECLIVI
jgi:hypothetical protein